MMDKKSVLRVFIKSALFLILFSSPISAMDLSGLRGEIAFGAFLFEPSGNHSYTKTKTGTVLDLESDMNLEDDNAFYGRLKLEGLGDLPGVSLNASILESEGKGSKAFTYGDQAFVSSSAFDSKVTLQNYDLTVFYNLKGLSTATLGRIKVDLGAALRWFDAEGRISQSSSSSVIVNETDYSLALYADLLVRPLEGLELAVEWKGFSFSEAEFSNLTGRISYQVLGPMFVSGGYMMENMTIDQNGFKLDIDTKGAFIEAGYRF